MGVRASSALSSGLLGAIAEMLFVPALLAVVIGLDDLDRRHSTARRDSVRAGTRSAGVDGWIRRRRRRAWVRGFAGSSVAASSSLVTDLADRLRRDHRAHDRRARHFVRAWLADAVRLDEPRRRNRGRVRGVDDRSRRGHLGPVRQTAGDAAACPRRRSVLASRSSTRGEDGRPAVLALDERKPLRAERARVPRRGARR